MRPEELTALLRHRPFAPLRVHLTDGHFYEINHPEQIIVGRSRVDIGIAPDPATGVVDHVEHCSLLHIVRIEPIATLTQSNNGPGG
jgi:hypothetical protein